MSQAAQTMVNPLQDLFPAPATRGGKLFWPNEGADRGYVIFFTGRCGSTELVEMLSKSKVCGVPDEFFNEEFIRHHNADWQCEQMSTYIANLVRNRSLGRVFGFKIDGFRHRQLCAFVDPMSYFPATAFSYFYMSRRNLLDQAYSYAHAKLTGIWHQPRDSARADIPAQHPVNISDTSIWSEISFILEQEFYFETYFVENSMSVHRIDYETLCANKFLLVADVMLTLGCTSAAVQTAIAALDDSFHKLAYDSTKFQRLVEFRSRYDQQLSYLVAQRGRLPLDSIRSYVRRHAGVELAEMPG